MPAIEVSHLTKEYRLGALQSLKDKALQGGRRLLGKPVPERQLFKALDDISFNVDPGEVVGIIGHNGAGKSTLLKMLARISTPTSGSVKVTGRIAPLIEVGAGFVPDFTGRENVYLNGSIMGMRKKEIDRKFDEIVDFAEMAEFIDTPVKRYSSGMQVKLAFSVATSIESEILIVDEVLAVGDLAFQRKCFDRMEDVIRRQGRTVLLVSHNIRQVERLCSRTVLLDHGRVARDGKPSEVCTLFYENANTKIINYSLVHHSGRGRVETSGEVELASVTIVDEQGQPLDAIRSNDPLCVRIRFHLKTAVLGADIIVGTHSTDFVYLSAGSTASQGPVVDLPAGTHEIEYRIPYFPLVSGVYCIRFSVYDRNKRPVFVGETLTTFKVTAASNEVREPGSRMLHIPAQWKLDGSAFGAVVASKSADVLAAAADTVR
jgi:ABC-type polysaccharide/polyol phosphate transport system ATPase subunit